jgi:hypothetical protein
MASKRVTSESGSYMSQYDQEVEKRLKEIESSIQKLSSQKVEAPAADTTGLEAKLDLLISILKRDPSLNIEKLSGGAL